MPIMTEKKKEQWIRINEAAQHFGVSRSKIYTTIKQHNLQKRTDALDTRIKLVSLTDLQRIYERE